MKAQPVIEIDTASNAPVFEQIADQIRRLIVQRDLTPGDQLPSVRNIALQLGIHFNTVAQAYRTLETEGWLSVKRRSGTTVRDNPLKPLQADEKENLVNKFQAEAEALVSRYMGKGVLPADLFKTLDTIHKNLISGDAT